MSGIDFLIEKIKECEENGISFAEWLENSSKLYAGLKNKEILELIQRLPE